ncbi:MAG: hypothetical protein ACLVBP_17345 [Ruminococcus sp.]
MRKKSHILVARYLADQMPATKSLQSHRKGVLPWKHSSGYQAIFSYKEA